MNIKTRQRIEKRIVKQIVKSALEQGYSISIMNGGCTYEIHQSVNKEDIHKELFATDQESLYFFMNGKCFGIVFLVYGNDGYDVICDYSGNEKTEKILKEANALASKLEEEYA